MAEDMVNILIGAKLVDPEQARSDAQDLAWDHAKFASDFMEFSLGSKEFEKTFKAMLVRYEGITDYLEFFTYTGMLLLRSLINEGLIQLTEEMPITDQHLADIIGEVTEVIVASYAWLIVGMDMWPTNDEMPDESGITFTFPADDIIIENPTTEQ